MTSAFTQPASSPEEFMARLDVIEKIANSKNLLLNKDLEATNKWGLRWIVRVIISPLCYLFCRDPFSDVKMNHVAQKLEEYLRINQQHFGSTNSSREVKIISDRIIARLNERTHNRYDAVLGRVLKQQNDRLAGLERAEADAAQRAAWGTEVNGLRRELNGLREVVARAQNPQNGELQRLQNQQAALQTGLEKLRGTVVGNQNRQQADLQRGLARLGRELNGLKEVVARAQNPQNGELPQQAALQTGLERLRRELEALKGTVAENQNRQQADLQTGLARLEGEFGVIRGTVVGNQDRQQADVQTLRGELEGLRTEVAIGRTSRDALQARFDALQANIQEQLQDFNGDIGTLTEAAHELESEVDTLSNHVDDQIEELLEKMIAMGGDIHRLAGGDLRDSTINPSASPSASVTRSMFLDRPGPSSIDLNDSLTRSMVIGVRDRPRVSNALHNMRANSVLSSSTLFSGPRPNGPSPSASSSRSTVSPRSQPPEGN